MTARLSVLALALALLSPVSGLAKDAFVLGPVARCGTDAECVAMFGPELGQ